MRKWIALMMAVVVLSGCSAAAPHEGSNSGYRQISMEEAVAMMETDENFIILDVRTAEEYEAGHIPGAVHVANESIGTEDIPELPDKDRLIMVYCRSGNRSKQASEKLEALGYNNIVEFGGIIDWPGEIAVGAE